jgi:hypothetical protein
MIEFLISVVLSIVAIVMAERCRRDPEKCKDGFMKESGWTRSIFALPYLGRAAEARRAIVEDAGLRRRYRIELYVWALVLFLLGLTRLFATA